MSELAKSEAMSTTVVLVPVLTLIAAAILANLLSLRTYALSSEWALSLITIVAVVSLLLEMWLSFYGFRRKYGSVSILFLVLGQATAASVADFIWGRSDLSGASALFIAAIFFSMFGWVLQSTSIPATTILRSVKGFRSTGLADASAVILKVPKDLLDKYGREFLEDRIGEELKGYSEEDLILVPARETKIGYSIARSQNQRFLFGVSKASGLVSVLCIRLDGIVCKFGENSSEVKEIEFGMQTRFTLDEPTEEERTSCVNDLTAAYLNYSKPLLDFHEVRTYATKGVRTHQTQIALMLAVGLVSALVFVDNPLVASLTGQKVLLWLALVSVISSFAYLWDRTAKRVRDNK